MSMSIDLLPKKAEVSPHKAYQIDLTRIDEGYLLDKIMCYANSLNEAKMNLLKQVIDSSWELKYSTAEISYINIPVIRRKSDDKIFFEGNYVTENEKNIIIFNRDRIELLTNILNDKNIKYCYIKKGAYYRPNSCGYTDLISQAGVYEKDYAVSHAKSVKEIILIPIDIKSHNEMINAEILQLSSRLL